jgi:hypothetical protein
MDLPDTVVLGHPDILHDLVNNLSLELQDDLLNNDPAQVKGCLHEATDCHVAKLEPSVSLKCLSLHVA